jgi:hypothetical protein
MIGIAAALFALGFGASWVAGRYIGRGATAVQGGAVGLCGVAALLFGLPQVWTEQVFLAIVILLAYGLIAAFIFRAARVRREGME